MHPLDEAATFLLGIGKVMLATTHIFPPTIQIDQWIRRMDWFQVACCVAGIGAVAYAGWKIARNLQRNEPGLTQTESRVVFVTITACAGFYVYRSENNQSLWLIFALALVAAAPIWWADHRRFVRDPSGKIVADRWQVVLRYAGFSWTRDKLNRHFFISGETGAGKTTGMNQLLEDLFKRDPRLGGMVMANKGDEWFYLEWLGKKYGRSADLLHLRPRSVDSENSFPKHRLNVTGDTRLPYTTRARILVDTAAALNPKDEKSFFKNRGASHIGRTLELLALLKRPVTPTNVYLLLTNSKELKDALHDLADVSAKGDALIKLFEANYLNHEGKEQRAGELGTSQNYLEYLGTPEIAEVFSSDEPDTCTVGDVDRGKILCIDVPEDFPTERKYVFTVMKLLLYRHALRRYDLPTHARYQLNQLIYCGDEFATAITASYDGTSDYNVVDKLRDCWLSLIVSSQAYESLIPPQTKEQAEVLLLNLKNLFMYRAASELDALRCANAIGKHWVSRTSQTTHTDHTSSTTQRILDYRIQPHEFRGLPDHTAIVRHCTNGYKRMRLHPN